MRGGKREGAGRKKYPEELIRVNIVITKPQKKKLKDYGGSKWVRNKIEEENDIQLQTQIS
jgi:hypothetical protein